MRAGDPCWYANKQGVYRATYYGLCREWYASGHEGIGHHVVRVQHTGKLVQLPPTGWAGPWQTKDEAVKARLDHFLTWRDDLRKLVKDLDRKIAQMEGVR